MTSIRRPTRAVTFLTLLVAAAAGACAGGLHGPSSHDEAAGDLPDIVFVSRRPIQGAPHAIPGFGPRDRAVAAGGRLLVRTPDGRIHPLVPSGRFFDVSDPAVSYDGRRVAFAGLVRPDSAWRIWIVGADGQGLVPVTHSDRAIDLRPLGREASRFRRYDDLDPCWLPDGRICFASTRYPEESEAGTATTNLFVVHPDGSDLMRITGERNGADEPSVDPTNGRIVYARWWTSRFFPSDEDSAGITEDPRRALPAERLSLWHAITIKPDGDGLRLAGGFPRRRDRTMAYQPIVLGDGTLVGVTADTLALLPRPGRTSLCIFPGRFGPPILLPAPPASMCGPVELPDGDLLVSYDPRGRGDFGLARVRRDGSGLTPVLDRRGWDDLDPAVLAPRPLPPVLGPGLGGLTREVPPHDRGDLAGGATVRFDCLNVFANGPVDFPIPDAPAPVRDLHIRFFATLSRPGHPFGDTTVFVRKEDVTRSGAIHVDTAPADVPMFEQLVDAHGHIVRGSSGPAHVPGFNAGRVGSGTQCVGCHVGHSAIPVELNYALGKRFNAAPSARVSVSGPYPGRAAALVDRRTRGPADSVAWVVPPDRGPAPERIQLEWSFPLAVDSLVVYGVRPESAPITDLRVQGVEITEYRAGKVVSRQRSEAVIDPAGTRISCGGVQADRIVIEPLQWSGRVAGRPALGLAEIEARVRIPED